MIHCLYKTNHHLQSLNYCGRSSEQKSPPPAWGNNQIQADIIIIVDQLFPNSAPLRLICQNVTINNNIAIQSDSHRDLSIWLSPSSNISATFVSYAIRGASICRLCSILFRRRRQEFSSCLLMLLCRLTKIRAKLFREMQLCSECWNCTSGAMRLLWMNPDRWQKVGGEGEGMQSNGEQQEEGEEVEQSVWWQL